MVRRMTEKVDRREAPVARALSVLLLVGAGIRIAAAIVSGFVEWHESQPPFVAPGRDRAVDVLTTFGAAGDGTGVLLLAAASATAWWTYRLGDERAASVQRIVAWLAALTALLALMQGVGLGLLFAAAPAHQDGRFIKVEGDALAYLVLALGVLYVARRLASIADESMQIDIGVDAFVFAVDRRSGDVRAFLSAAEAQRRMHVYSVEDDEFAFYTDEGVVLDASIVDDRIVLQSTEQVRPTELLERLKEFANRRGITVDDVDDATAYAVPISRWHWLEMWPPWLRPIGMLFRRTG